MTAILWTDSELPTSKLCFCCDCCSHYEDDFEPDDDDMVEEEIARLADPPQRKVTPRLHPATNDDIYDFSSNSLGF